MEVFLSRALAAGSIVAFWMLGYHLIALGIEPTHAHILATGLDDAIPFVSWTVYLYSWVYTSMLYPAFVIRSPVLFRRVFLAYLAVIGPSLVVFAYFPVTAIGLRPDVSVLDTSVFHELGVRLTYFVDPPYNLFPSLHLSIATIAFLSAWKARRLYGILYLPIVAAVGVSICTMKQHYIADGLAALVLAGIVYALVLRPFWTAPRRERDIAYGWTGPAGYLAFHSCVYLGLYVAFEAGFAPW